MTFESASTTPMPARPRVTLLQERSAPAAPEPASTSASDAVTPSVTEPSSATSRRDYLGEVTAVLTAIAMLAAARIILLLTVSGAFILACLAISNATIPALVTAATFDVLIVIPVVLLYYWRG